MQDRIEKFIRENKEGLDMQEPRQQLWDKIDEGLQHKKIMRHWRVTTMAASFFLVVIMAGWSIFYYHKEEPAYKAQATLPQNEVYNAEFYYTGIIEARQQELLRYASTDSALYREFTQDIAALQKMYAQLKSEYAGTHEKDIVLQAMIENLQLQIRIIEKQLSIIKQLPAHKVADTTQSSFI